MHYSSATGAASVGAAGSGRGALALAEAGFGSGLGGAGGGVPGKVLPREPLNNLPRFVRLSPLPMGQLLFFKWIKTRAL